MFSIMRSATNTNMPPTNTTSWEGNDVIEFEERQPSRLFQLWYKWTAIPEPPAPASFVKREAARRSRLVSIISLLLIGILVLFLPGSAATPNPLEIPLNLFLIAVCLIAILFNRRGMTIIAGATIVIASEIDLTATIVSTTPFYELAIALYSLYVITEFLAVSLLPKGYVFLVATINCLLIWLSITYQKQTPVMAADMHKLYWGAFLLQVGLQIIVAGIAFIWVSNATKALRRANRAEMVAALEHRLGQQKALALQEKQQLEESIQQLVEAYVDATKSQLVTKIPYPPAKVLWPLVGVINALWVRLQHTNQVEQDFQKLEQAIVSYTEFLRTAEQFPDKPLPSYRTRTALDPLVIALGQVHNAVRTRHK
jgi:large-conductance mechanosensitive channel